MHQLSQSENDKSKELYVHDQIPFEMKKDKL